ncbi:hypothetical protein AMS68_007827 [Peltaster fructicola]|uniref:NADH:flavin oxidoreductase/NADH oxidase N-terminal domain-containing protein n=1 Tax=Peltaster fructicola TaxID=286661 RepID=A0A6H0Y6T4_9PEZI|nr:hypothetical protein AMS68_007827 [Peltaster fructicola]
MSHHNVHVDIKTAPEHFNKGAKGISYFTPTQDVPPGTALIVDKQKHVAKLFKPLQIRGMVMPNRIMLSPLCQYSAEDGHYTMWHWAHIGGIAQRGPGLITVEATGVQARGRITPEDVGIWKDSQIEPLGKAVEFAHSQNVKIMIQLAHAGRKASTVAPWLSSGAVAGKDANGWPDDVWAPSAIAWNEHHAQPKAMTLEDIETFKKDWAAAVKRAIKAGFDAIEIHNAHGYLLHSFISPVSNQRTDQYGGSFENRTRLTLEVVKMTREIIPKDMPLFLRISATDWLEESGLEGWTSADTVKLAPLLAEAGVDVLDVSTGGNHPKQHPHVKPAYQAPYAVDVKKAVGDKLLVGSVGSIETAELANDLLEKDNLDIVTIGRGFQKNPGLVFKWADDLKQEIQMPSQIRWGFGGRGKDSATPILDLPELSGLKVSA